VEAVCRRSGVTDVVDVGSGEGYLDAVPTGSGLVVGGRSRRGVTRAIQCMLRL